MVSNTVDMRGDMVQEDAVEITRATATCSSNACTVTSYLSQITTESLSTAAGSSQAITITLNGVTTADEAFVQGTGTGTNTRNHTFSASCTANTITVTIKNIEPTNALNGTIIFNVDVIKGS